ncbi:MAG: TIGR03936 family radical SAM-associated protein [Bacillota bacterium]|nr:TIGR03936 family radical SAM-associated protein [Bacillota bacterium]MDW7683307.1 TIGR03936 family radical SAM-associated protein [Bacillota bacterium]
MRIWIQFAKESPLRYLSHLDLMRAWQRALRRAQLPVAYSAGFNPHPRMSFASALAVGVTSEAEYLDIHFTRDLSGEDFDRLESQLPAGLKILAHRTVSEAAPAVMALIGAAVWTLPLAGEDTSVLRKHIEKILLAESLSVIRKGKKGDKSVDVRPLIYNLTVDDDENRLVMVLASGGEGGAKPREILALLDLLPLESRLHRKALLIHRDGCLQSPMAVLLNEKEVSIDAKKDCYQL